MKLFQNEKYSLYAPLSISHRKNSSALKNTGKNQVKTYLFAAIEDKVKTFDPRALNPSTNKQEETRSRGKTIEGSKTEKPHQFAKGILRQGRHRTPPRVEIHNIRSSLPEPEIEVLYTVYQGEIC